MENTPLLVRASTYLTNPKLSQQEILKSDESCIGEEIPSSQRRGGRAMKKMFPFRLGAAGVARSASPTRSASAIARSLKRERSLNRSSAKSSGLNISPN